MAAIRSEAEWARLREEFRARVDEAFRQMVGADGQNGLVAFTQREDRACEGTDAWARWLREEHLALDPATDPGAQVDCPICGGPVRYDSPEQAELEIRAFQTRRGKIEYERAARRCPRCRKIFSLLDERPRLGTEGYSPRGLQKIEYAGADEVSFEQAAVVLRVLAEVSIRAKHVQRITERLGAQRRGQRDAAVAAFQAGTLQPEHPEPPEGAAITSAPVESLIKQFNQRVKGTEKFGLRGGGESVLQARTAHLSEDDRAERFHDRRPRGRAVGQNRLRPAAGTVMHPATRRSLANSVQPVALPVPITVSTRGATDRGVAPCALGGIEDERSDPTV